MALGDPIGSKDLVCAIARTMIVFHDYRDQLGKLDENSLTETFFKDLIRTWGLARTIGKEKRKEIQNSMLAGDLRQLKKGGVTTVDKIAGKYSERGLGARKSGKNTGDGDSDSHRKPRSLVSKIGFFAVPAFYAPYDTYARDGLNVRRGRKTEGGLGYLPEGYEHYLESFNQCYTQLRNQIADECSKEWAIEMADKLCLARRWRGSKEFKRKVLDDVLMTEGGRSR